MCTQWAWPVATRLLDLPKRCLVRSRGVCQNEVLREKSLPKRLIPPGTSPSLPLSLGLKRAEDQLDWGTRRYLPEVLLDNRSLHFSLAKEGAHREKGEAELREEFND